MAFCPGCARGGDLAKALREGKAGLDPTDEKLWELARLHHCGQASCMCAHVIVREDYGKAK